MCACARVRPANVLLLVIDALRPDHTGFGGYDRPTTPCLDSLARQGVVFERAQSVANFTRASVPSMLTGVAPSVHGVSDADDRLSDAFVTLAETLRERGYATAAYAPNPSLDRRLNFGQGFEVYDDTALDNRQSVPWKKFETARRIQSAALEFLDGGPGKPYFLYLHYRDAHRPYVPPPPYDRLFWSGPARQWEFSIDEGPGDLEYYRSQYDAEIRYTDDRICEFLDELERRGRRDDTIVVITSDHGEAFLEHGVWEHGNDLYQEEIRVPLVILRPGGANGANGGGAGRRSQHAASGVDLMPTILDLLGLEIPRYVQGTSLVPALDGREDRERPVFAEGKRRAVALRRGNWKLLRLGRGGGWRLFDLDADPRELDDRWSRELDRGRDLVRLLRRQADRDDELAERFPTMSVGRDPEVDAQLRALGYLD